MSDIVDVSGVCTVPDVKVVDGPGVWIAAVILFTLTEHEGHSLIIIIAGGGVAVIAVAAGSGVTISIVLLAIICIVAIVLVRKGRRNPSKIFLK